MIDPRIAEGVKLVPTLRSQLANAKAFDHITIDCIPHTIETIIAALVAAGEMAGERQGWKLVPVEPTEAMIEAWEKSKPYDGDYTDEKCATACWKDMVAAATGEKT